MPVCRAREVFGVFLQFLTGGVLSVLIFLAIPSLGRTQTTESGIQNPDAIGGGLFIAGNSLYVAAWGYGLQVLDISTPTRPKWIGAWNHRGAPNGVYVVGSRAYVANRPCGLEVLDVHDPRNPVSLANLRTGGDAMGVFVKGQFAYMADGVLVNAAEPYSYMPEGNKGLKVIDIEDPRHPRLVGGDNLPSPSQDMPATAKVARVVNLRRIVYEIVPQTAAIPALRQRSGIAGAGNGFHIAGNFAYLASWSGGLRIYDVTDPNQPREICNFKTPYSTWDVRVTGKHAYVMDSGASIHVLDVSDPAKPQEVGQFSCTGYVSRWIALQPAVREKIAENLPTPSGAPAPELKPIDTAPPQLINPRRLADGSFTFTLVGVANGSYVIQFTSDWSEWTNLSTNSLPANGHATIPDPHAAEATQRYYRAVRQ
jgi:hypothetical protein